MKKTGWERLHDFSKFIQLLSSTNKFQTGQFWLQCWTLLSPLPWLLVQSECLFFTRTCQHKGESIGLYIKRLVGISPKSWAVYPRPRVKLRALPSWGAWAVSTWVGIWQERPKRKAGEGPSMLSRGLPSVWGDAHLWAFWALRKVP